MAVIKSGVWKKLCLQFVHSFHGFEKVDEEFKEVFSSLVTFSEKLELDLKKDKFLELLVMQPEELVAQRKDGERQEEEVTTTTKKNKEIHSAGNGKKIFFF